MSEKSPVEQVSDRLAPWAVLLARLRPLVALALAVAVVAVVLATQGGKAAACRVYQQLTGTVAEDWSPLGSEIAHPYVALRAVVEGRKLPLPDPSAVSRREISAGRFEFTWRDAGEPVRYAVHKDDGVWVVNRIEPPATAWCAP